MNENRQVLEHLETLVGFPMSLLIYIERIVGPDIYRVVYSFHEMSDEDIAKLEKLAMPQSITKGFCKALTSFKKSGEYGDFLMKDIKEIVNGEELEKTDSEYDSEIKLDGMILPDLSVPAKEMPGTEIKESNTFYRYVNDSMLLVGRFDETRELSVYAVFESFKEKCANIGIMKISGIVNLYTEIAEALNKLEYNCNSSSGELVDIGERLISLLEMRSNIPYLDEESENV